MSTLYGNFPHVDSGEKYARDVIAGKIPACKWVRLACARHFADKKRKDWQWKFDPAAVERKAVFMELFPHTKGKWAAKSELFVAEPWQNFITLSIFGWIDKKRPNIRRFTRAMLMVPRKNGKSQYAALVGLAMFAADDEFGAEVYSGATSEKQAWEIFRPARLMADRTPDFQEFYGAEVMKSNLHIPTNGSRFEPVIGKPGDGSSPSCALIDEYHEHADDTLFDTMETGMVARERPLALIVSTSGDNLAGPCYLLQKDLEKILEGTIQNERFWGIVYSIDDTTDWTTEAALRMANPNIGVSVSLESLQVAQSEAIRNARKQSIFKIKHLNVWVGSRDAFFNLKAWLDCVRRLLKREDMKGLRLFLGLDLASKVDIAALCLLFVMDDGEYALFWNLYIPEAKIANGENPQYQAWALDGKLIVTDGEMIDYDRIEEDILVINEEFEISELAFDPAYSQMLVQHCMAEGITCVEVRPVVMQFSEPMKVLDGLILSGKIQHDGNECVTWQFSNVVAKRDNKDNVYPNKEKPESKIDAAVAAIMAMNRALVSVPEEEQELILTVID